MFKQFFALLLAVVMCAVALCSCSWDAVSVKYVKENTAQALADAFNYAEVLGIAPEKASNSAKITVISTDDKGEPEYQLSVAQDTAQQELFIGLDFDLLEQDADVNLYIDNQKIVAQSENILGGAYGVTFEEDFDTLVQKLDDSALAKTLSLPKGAIKYNLDNMGINQESLQKLKSSYEKYISDMEQTAFDSVRIFEAVAPYCGEITDEKVQLGGITYNCVAVNVKAEKQLVADVFCKVADMYNEKVRIQNEFLSSLSDTMKLDEISHEDINDILADIDVSGNIKLYLDKKTGLAVKIAGDVNLTTAVGTNNIKLDAYIDNGAKINLNISDKDGELLDAAAELILDSQKNLITLNLSSSITIDGETSCAKGTFVLDKSAKTFTFNSTDADGNEYGVSGTFESTDKLLRIAYDNIAQQDTQAKSGTEVIFETDVEIDVPEEYKDIATMTKEDAYILIGRVTNFGMRMMREAGLINIFPEPEVDFDSIV